MTKLFFSLFIGVLVAILVGVGISTFYPTPSRPDAEIEIRAPEPASPGTESAISSIKPASDSWEQYQNELQEYNRLFSIYVLVAAVTAVALGLKFSGQLVIADGLVVGGIFNLVHSIIRGFITQDSQFQFVIVALSLVISAIIGQKKLANRKAKN